MNGEDLRNRAIVRDFSAHREVWNDEYDAADIEHIEIEYKFGSQYKIHHYKSVIVGCWPGSRVNPPDYRTKETTIFNGITSLQYLSGMGDGWILDY